LIEFPIVLTLVTGVGDPHIVTIDNGRYTCHIQGLYTFAKTTDAAQIAAQNYEVNNVSDANVIYNDDLFEIYVQSTGLAPVIPYISQTFGYGSVFSAYTINASAANYTFVISNNNGQFGKISFYRF